MGLTLPRRLLVKMRYIETVDFADIVAGGVVVQTYRANSVYDPNFTGSGGQPSGYSLYSSVYARYRVAGCAIKVEAFNNCQNDTSTDDKVPRIAVVPWNAETALTSATDLTPVAALPGYKERTLAYGNGAKIIRGYTNLANMFGRTKLEWKTDPNNQAAYNANPVNAGYWFIITEAGDQGEVYDVVAKITLTYYVEWYDGHSNNWYSE